MDLKKLNVQEMNKNEMRKTNGGIWPVIVGLAVLYLVTNSDSSTPRK